MTFLNWLRSLVVEYRVWRYGMPARVCGCGCGKPEVRVLIDESR